MKIDAYTRYGEKAARTSYVVMQSTPGREGYHSTYPLSVHGSVDSAMAKIGELVHTWSADVSVRGCPPPAWYFVPVECV